MQHTYWSTSRKAEGTVALGAELCNNVLDIANELGSEAESARDVRV